MVDLVKLVRLPDDAQQPQKWQAVDGQLRCIQGSFVPKVVFPYQPPEEYDVQFEFTQHQLRNGTGVIAPNGAGASFAWLLGFGHGKQSGISVVGNRSPIHARRDDLVQANRKYAAVLVVRRDVVEGYLDGQRLFAYTAERAGLQVNPWHKIPDPSRLAIYCDDPTTFHSVKVIEVTSTGRVVR
jgi:hypothetical protein